MAVRKWCLCPCFLNKYYFTGKKTDGCQEMVFVFLCPCFLHNYYFTGKKIDGCLNHAGDYDCAVGLLIVIILMKCTVGYNQMMNVMHC